MRVYLYRFQGSFYKSVSVASHPAKKFSSARHFVHEQRKIIANFKAQPWPMQMKMAARKYFVTMNDLKLSFIAGI